MHRIPALFCSTLCTLALAWPAANVLAEDEPDQPQAEVQARELVTNLDNPTGLAIHPESGHILIASRPGILRYDPASKNIHWEVVGFPTDEYGKGPIYNIGPLGLAFLGEDRLVVGDGSRPDGQELVRIFRIAAEDDAPHDPFREDSAEFTLGPIEPSDETKEGEGNFYGVAIGAGAIFVTCNGDDTKGWIARSQIDDEGQPGALELFIATKIKTEEELGTGVDAPGPAVFTPDGSQLVVGQKGEVNIPGDSLLTMYDPETGDITLCAETGLNDIVGLAYSPKTGSLYATDFSWVDPADGGLYRLDVDGDEVEATKILALDKPTGMAFDKEGRLYVSVFGTAEEGAEKAPGKLLVIDAGL